MGCSGTEIPISSSEWGGGFLWLLCPPNRKLWSGEVLISCSCSWPGPGLRPAGMLGGGAWAGETRAEAAVREKAEEGVGLGLEASGGGPSLWVCCSGH